MGLSASQARFLQLTARRSNVEYQAQQINQQRLQLATKLEMYSNEYQAKISNRKMVFRYNNGTEVQNVDVTYQNYKNIMNQQQAGLSTTQDKIYLVSSSGNKLVVSNVEEMKAMMESISIVKTVPIEDDETEKIPEGAKISQDGKTYATTNTDENGNTVTVTKPVPAQRTQIIPIDNGLTEDDFLIVDNLEDPDAFQRAIQNGDYYFATMNEVEFDESGNPIISFKTDSWETIGGGVIQEEYDRTDDAEAEATFSNRQAKIQNMDKKLELELSKLESERNAIQTEIDSVKKVIDDNIEKGFKAFS